MPRRLPLALALSMALISACQALPQSSLSRIPVSSGAESGPAAMADPSLRGRAVFPERQVQITASDVVSYATVTLIDPSLGRTLVTGRTNASGSFVLSPDGIFNPPLDSYYYLEVEKRVSNSFGGNTVAMRTVLKWTATGWASLTNGIGGSGDIVINPTTTAVGLIDSEDSAISFGDILGKVSGAPGYTAVTSFGTHSAAEVIARADTVTSQLSGGGDPVGDRTVLAGGNLAPDDTGSATTHHDYVKTVNGVASTFVWIPNFTAYQLITPANCGGANTTKPLGTWVGAKPSTGLVDTDWAKETFGGFYAAKYEASRADAAQGAVGTGVGATVGGSNTLKVQERCVPWVGIDWDTAANACLSYDAHSHLMRDDEWTALAVWSMINNLTIYGNNAELNSAATYVAPSDIDDPAVTFLDDPAYGWSANGVDRSLTGTGKKAAWAGATNLTTHTGTTAGVYDLNGNVWEWTETIGAAITSGNYVVNDITVPVSVAQGNISALSTDIRLRRYGVPGTTAGQTATFGNDHLWKNASTNAKSLRGGGWGDGGNVGVWAFNLNAARSHVGPHVGFRPVLRY